ncbi:CCAAT- binding transcription factor component [Gurleya vavrai]
MLDYKNNTRNRLHQFWNSMIRLAHNDKLYSKDFNLPLARIKRLMKVEENVKMMASEVPILFSKITEVFIEELTARAWFNTEDNKRRIVQRSDLSAAVRTSDMYDFLIYIIPRVDYMPGMDFDEDNYISNITQIETEDESIDEQK